jgi:hypothetical protein
MNFEFDVTQRTILICALDDRLNIVDEYINDNPRKTIDELERLNHWLKERTEITYLRGLLMGEFK